MGQGNKKKTNITEDHRCFHGTSCDTSINFNLSDLSDLSMQVLQHGVTGFIIPCRLEVALLDGKQMHHAWHDEQRVSELT